jgi:streptomycin 3"-adenylyltransferase
MSHVRDDKAVSQEPVDAALPPEQVEAALAAIHRALGPDGIVGVYLFGSAVASGLRADSDLDLFVVTGRPITLDEKHRLVGGLRPISRRSSRPPGWRPLEVTVVTQSDVRPWHYPPRYELQYGEWLRDEDLRNQLDGGPVDNPDLAVLIAMVRSNGGWRWLGRHPARRSTRSRPRTSPERSMTRFPN